MCHCGQAGGASRCLNVSLWTGRGSKSLFECVTVDRQGSKSLKCTLVPTDNVLGSPRRKTRELGLKEAHTTRVDLTLDSSKTSEANKALVMTRVQCDRVGQLPET